MLTGPIDSGLVVDDVGVVEEVVFFGSNGRSSVPLVPHAASVVPSANTATNATATRRGTGQEKLGRVDVTLSGYALLPLACEHPAET